MYIKNRNDCFLGIAILIFSAFFYHETYNIKAVFSYSLGPTIFPRIILFLIGLLSIFLVFQSIEVKKNGECSNASIPKAVFFDLSRSNLLRIATFSLLLLYLLLLPILGYVVATIPFLFICMTLLGPKNAKSIAMYALISVSTCLFLQFLFGKVLKFFLP